MSGAMKFLCHIPEDIIANILSRLPVKPILRFRCVCKFWSNLTTDPNFIKMHLDQAIKNNNFSLFINPFNYGPLGEIACVDEDPSSSLAQELPSPSSFSSPSPLMSPLPLLLPSPSLSQSQSQSQLPISVSSISSQPYFQVDLPTSHVEAIEIDYPFKYSRSNVELLGSCNGLVCIKWYKGEYLCVWNPFTNEYKEIPKQLPTQFPRDSRIHGINAYGFGCDCNNKNYKIVRIITSESEEYDSEVHVYTFESDCWTIIEPTPFGTQERLRGMLVKGVLHFLSKHTNVIFSFDIISEIFYETPIPYLLEDPFATEIGVLQGDLSLVGHCYQIRVDVWIMEDYGEKISWIKIFSINQPSVLRSLNYRRPIQICKNGEILIEVIFQEEDDYGLVLYDPKTESGRLIKMCGNTDGWNDVQDYVGTLVSLKSGTYCGGRRSKRSNRESRK